MLNDLRQPHRALHALLWAVLLCLMLGTLAQAGHTHLSQSNDAHVTCDLCVSMGGLMTGPERQAQPSVALATVVMVLLLAAQRTGWLIPGLRQARAPPYSC